MDWSIRGYRSYRKVQVNGRNYYRLDAYFYWRDVSEEDSVTKPIYAALHKYADPGSDRPAFRVLMTNKDRGAHYWRRFEALGSKPPNTVIVGGPNFKQVKGQYYATWELFSPDRTARFLCRVAPLGVQRGAYKKCGKTVTVPVLDEPQIFQARAYDAAGHVDRTPAQAKYTYH